LVWIRGPPGCGKSFLVGITIPKLLGVTNVVRKDPFTKWFPATAKGDYCILEDIDKSFARNLGNSYLKIWGD